jgi:nitrogen PTS system EIIA component
MDLYNILDKKCCIIDVSVKTKEDALRVFAKQAKKSNLLKNYTVDDIYNKLLVREEQGSTGFGNGIALPHSRLEGMEDFLLFIVIVPKGVHFDSMDKKKVSLFFIILGPPEKTKEYLKVLATVSRTIGLSGVKKELLGCKKVDSLYESFLQHTSFDKDEKVKQQKMKLLYIILYYEEYVYEILEFFVQEGIDGASIMESSGMGSYISNIPLFAGFLGFMNENKNHSKTLMALIPENKASKIIEGVENITGDLNTKQGAMIIMLDVPYYKGTMKMM